MASATAVPIRAIANVFMALPLPVSVLLWKGRTPFKDYDAKAAREGGCCAPIFDEIGMFFCWGRTNGADMGQWRPPPAPARGGGPRRGADLPEILTVAFSPTMRGSRVKMFVLSPVSSLLVKVPVIGALSNRFLT